MDLRSQKNKGNCWELVQLPHIYWQGCLLYLVLSFAYLYLALLEYSHHLTLEEIRVDHVAGSDPSSHCVGTEKGYHHPTQGLT